MTGGRSSRPRGLITLDLLINNFPMNGVRQDPRTLSAIGVVKMTRKGDNI